MAKCWSDIECKCGFKTKVTYKKPDYFTPTTGTFLCSTCASKLKFRVAKIKQGKKGEVNITGQVIETSQALLEILIEESCESETQLDDGNRWKG